MNSFICLACSCFSFTYLVSVTLIFSYFHLIINLIFFNVCKYNNFFLFPILLNFFVAKFVYFIWTFEISLKLYVFFVKARNTNFPVNNKMLPHNLTFRLEMSSSATLWLAVTMNHKPSRKHSISFIYNFLYSQPAALASIYKRRGSDFCSHKAIHRAMLIPCGAGL